VLVDLQALQGAGQIEFVEQVDFVDLGGFEHGRHYLLLDVQFVV
jgi:hypothetical protein